VSFWLKPSGFFNQNPSLDAAPIERGEDAPAAPDRAHANCPRERRCTGTV
jgi:hypothetical protein